MGYNPWFFRKNAFWTVGVIILYNLLLLELISGLRQDHSGVLALVLWLVLSGGPMLIGLLIWGTKSGAQKETQKWRVGYLLNKSYIHTFYVGLLFYLALNHLLMIGLIVFSRISLLSLALYPLILGIVPFFHGFIMDMHVRR